MLTLPALAILLTAAALLGAASQWRVSLILAFFFWTTHARIVRGNFLSLREKEYVEAAKAAGARRPADHVPPHPPEHVGPVVVSATLAVAAAILLEAALVVPRLRHQAADARRSACSSPTGQNEPADSGGSSIFPGLMIVLIVLCVNFIGDGLRDALDPQQRRVRA